jgi:ectoine hydroxylase
MDASCLQYQLTDEERHTFETTGILQIPDALSPEQVASLTAASDRIYERHVAAGHDPHTALFYPNFIPDDEQFADLVDYAPILPKVWGILGWNIYLYHAHLIVTPPLGRPRDDKT